MTDDEVAAAMRMLFECTHNVVRRRGGGGGGGRGPGKVSVCRAQGGVILSGGNIDRDVFAAVLNGKRSASLPSNIIVGSDRLLLNNEPCH
ncbi:MAG: hypothetical protein MZV70_03680 [Desulfobacterales bacterium]|nr:hypothetical protein [Desulfobacterales bacterium]